MSQTADRYAKALFELAHEQNSLEAVQESMTGLRNLILNVPEFRMFISNPLLTQEDRISTVNVLFKGKIPDLLLTFLLFVIYKSRLDILKEMIHSFDNLYLKSTNHVRAYVTTAVVLDKEERVLINQRLRNKFQFDMLTTWKIDPSLIGGFRIFVQGKVYDYSFKNQLNHFTQQATQPI